MDLTPRWFGRSARGVQGLADGFQKTLDFPPDVPEANCLPQGLHPPAKPVAKLSPNGAAMPRAKPSGKVAAKLAAFEPIPVALVAHDQLFKVQYLSGTFIICQLCGFWHFSAFSTSFASMCKHVVA